MLRRRDSCFDNRGSWANGTQWEIPERVADRSKFVVVTVLLSPPYRASVLRGRPSNREPWERTSRPVAPKRVELKDNLSGGRTWRIQ